MPHSSECILPANLPAYHVPLIDSSPCEDQKRDTESFRISLDSDKVAEFPQRGAIQTHPRRVALRLQSSTASLGLDMGTED